MGRALMIAMKRSWPTNPSATSPKGLGIRGVATLRYDMRTIARPDDLKAVND